MIFASDKGGLLFLTKKIFTKKHEHNDIGLCLRLSKGDDVRCGDRSSISSVADGNKHVDITICYRFIGAIGNA